MNDNEMLSAGKGTTAEVPPGLYETRCRKGEPAVHAIRKVVQTQNLVNT